MSGGVDMKVVILGDMGAGKTCLVECYLYDRLAGTLPYHNTIGGSYARKRIAVNGDKISMGIWDTCGQERFISMTRNFYRNAHAAIMCYDLTQLKNFQRIKSLWVKDLLDAEENCKIYLCGTKKDLINDQLSRRRVSYHDATDYAEEIDAEVFETSSKTGENLKELFYKIASDFHESRQKQSRQKDANVVHLDEQEDKLKCFCRCD